MNYVHSHTRTVYLCLKVELGWQTKTNSLWLCFESREESPSFFPTSLLLLGTLLGLNTQFSIYIYTEYIHIYMFVCF